MLYVNRYQSYPVLYTPPPFPVESALIPRIPRSFRGMSGMTTFFYKCDRGKKVDKILKNAEKSYDHGHARVSMPNKAKHKIFAKYFFKHSS